MGLRARLSELVNPSRSAIMPGLTSSYGTFWPFANFDSHTYPLTLTMSADPHEEMSSDFPGLVARGYKGNGIVFACIATRMMIFSEGRFQFQQIRKGRPGKLYGNDSLGILDHPWPGGTTGDLLTQMLVDADLAGNAYVTRRANQLVRMRPDWVSIMVGSPSGSLDATDLDAELLGYVYWPGGKNSGKEPVGLLREQVAHFKPIPDPASRFLGMSWMSPIIREVMSDDAATSHKLKFFENGATPNMVITRQDSVSKDTFDTWVKMLEQGHAGTANAYKTMYLDAGVDATVVGKDLQQLEFKVTQGAGETRIAAAAGVHPVIVGLSEGLAGSSLNAGNFNSARRLVADRTMHPLWRNVAGSLEVIVRPPKPDRLWIDTRDIPFLRADAMDQAEIISRQMLTAESGVRAGYTAESARDAVVAGDMSLLVHTGLFSVQLQPAGFGTADAQGKALPKAPPEAPEEIP